MKDYYKVLGVPRVATASQIKQAYRNLLKACHPDVNSSPQATEWTRQLNEAYATLSDAQAKLSYDMDLKLEESKRREPSVRQTETRHRTTGSEQSPRAEPAFRCERCDRIDSSLRMSAMWRVFSFINYSRKSPSVKILCGRCRVKESLAASATTVLLGWWSVWGFFWTLEALFNNARGGEQPVENNAALLKALGYQLYRSARHQEAYEALLAASRLQPDRNTEEALNSLKQYSLLASKKTFWERFRNLDLHPIYYHAPAGAVGLAFLLVAFSVLNANSAHDTPSTAQPALPTHSASPLLTSTASDPADAQASASGSDNRTPLDLQPVFSEPEQPMPQQGGLEFADGVASYGGVTAPLKITTKASDGNYVMKIVDATTGEFVATYFIERGNTLSIEVPLGSYKLKFAAGSAWYGMKHLFGPNTSYSYIPDKLTFYVSGDYSRGHAIELIPQVGGNLDTRKMRPEDW